MEHVKIWLQIITLIAGTGVLINTYKIYLSFHYQYLRHLLLFFLFFNLYLFFSTLTNYLLINFFDNLQLFKSSGYMKVTEPLATLFSAGKVYFMTALFRSFQNKQRYKSLHRLLIGCAIVIVIYMLLSYVNGLPYEISKVMDLMYSGVYFFVYLLFFCVLFCFVFSSIRQEDKERATTWTIFSLYYLSGYLVIFFSSVFAGPHHRLTSSAVYLTSNIFPFIWYRLFLLKNSKTLAFAVTSTDINTVFGRFGVSGRQSEIIELILQGKSNREIAGTLFIAPHTVKNQIYNVYQKIGVKSRFELINFFIEQCKRHNAHTS